jgi:hypothetical protein
MRGFERDLPTTLLKHSFVPVPRQKSSLLQTAGKQGVRPNAVNGGISRNEKAGAAKLALDFLARDGRQ